LISWVDGPIFEPTQSPTAEVGYAEGKVALPAFFYCLLNQIMRRAPLSMSYSAYLQLNELFVNFPELPQSSRDGWSIAEIQRARHARFPV